MKLDAAVKLESLTAVLGEPPQVQVPVVDDEDDGAMPAELRQWLVQLRLLRAVPFAYLVADSALLPEESIRWFYVDRRWTDALVQGALSVGTVNSDDRTHLTAQYPAIRAELDHEERNQRRDKVSGRLPRLTGDRGPVSGFLLRSRAVSGWPALHVRAFDVDPDEADDAKYAENDPRRMQLLRLERLAPAVLLCLFDGIPKVVHIEEPRQGVQFGFEARRSSGDLRATLRPRNASTFDYLPGAAEDVPFRTGASGVVDIKALEKKLKLRTGSGAADGLDSSEYALQLVRLPWRQVWGDPEAPQMRTVFRPTVKYQVMVDRMFVQDRP